ncbi:phosphoesterase DHHA1 [Thermofilum pendens]|uniref:Phosphoesterase, DHHA1 n=1 Tax=Thermofilum pendens (strain DSM 2475 / Hrk 5) TaxID=368408 RepID=A1RYK9_THEPD|nr:phosphoesterase DHHA1 [Thermofilum pendens]ABL78289.1 phosphoesterase, DHHA1 [Thermofilum pendens Hrk 5]
MRIYAFVLHGDLDGLSATATVAAALKHAEKDAELRFYFSQPYELDKDLARVDPRAEGIYIVDLAIDADVWPRLSAELGKLVASKRVTWIDHHPSTIERVEELKRIGVEAMLAEAASASTIARSFLDRVPDPAFFEKIITIGEVADRAVSVAREDPLFHYVEVLSLVLGYRVRDEQIRRRILRAWITERVVVPDEVAKAASEAEKVFQDLLREARLRVVYRSEKVVAVDMRDKRVYGFAGMLASIIASEEGRIALILSRVGEAALLTLRAPPGAKGNPSKTAWDVASRYGGSGGGHAGAASFKVPGTYAEKVLAEIVRALETG